MTNSNPTWGGRFKKPLDPLVHRFNASLAFDHILLMHDIKGSIVHARMLAKQKLISKAEEEQIVSGLLEIRSATLEEQIALDPTVEDVHMLIEQLLIEKIGDVGKKLHTGRSRNDQVALDLKLYLRDANAACKLHLETLIQTLINLGHKHKAHQLPGYTHLQGAQPIHLNLYFTAYAAMFKRDVTRMQDWHQRMNLSPLGAGALAGSQLPIDRHWVAEKLEFAGIVENTLDAVSDRDFVLEWLSVASIIMLHLSRLAEDLIIWSTKEFGFISLDDAFATGSSLMPNKKNPDVLELMRGKSGRVFGHLLSVLVMMKGLPLAYNKDMQEDKEALFDTVQTLSICLEVMSPFLISLHVNVDVMQNAANCDYLKATAYVEQLVSAGVPFREAHHQIGLCIKEMEETGISLHELFIKKFAQG